MEWNLAYTHQKHERAHNSPVRILLTLKNHQRGNIGEQSLQLPFDRRYILRTGVVLDEITGSTCQNNYISDNDGSAHENSLKECTTTCLKRDAIVILGKD